MSDTPENPRHELQAAQRALAELQAKLENRETTYRLTTLELEESRSALLFMLEDLEAGRKKIEQAHQEWIAALDAVNDPIFLHDKQFRILRCNKAYQQRAGIPFHELIGRPYYEVFPKIGAPFPCCLHAMEKAEEEEEEEEEVAFGDAIYRSRTFSIHDEHGDHLYSVHILEDITESKLAEQELKNLSDRLHHILVSTPAVHYACQVDGEYFVPTFASANLKAIWGYDPAEYLDNAEWWWSGIHPEGRDSVVKAIRAAAMAADCSHYAHEYRFRRKDGTYRWVHDELQIIRDQAGQPLEIVGSWLDITESKLAEEKRRESEKLYRSLFENMLNGFAYCQMIFEQDQPQDFIYLIVNAAFETLTGLKNVAGKRVSEVIPGIRQSDPGLFEIYGRVSLSGKPERFEIYVEALQQWFWISVYSPGKGYFVAVFDVITERKAAEATIQHANRALATLSVVNRNLVYATDENKLLQAICQAIVEQRGYRMAWVGYKQHDENKSIRIMAHAGHDEGYLDAMQLTWAETERGMGPSGRAIRSGTTQLCQDMINDPSYLLWRAAAFQRGYASDIALPLTRESGDVFGILHVYSGETNAFTPAEIDLLEEMAGDLSFGVRSLHTRQERDLALELNRQQLVQLQDSLEDTVRAIATIVEMRDPYTAGHQVRVADLAAAIARQMGLPDEQAHAIHLAGIVHDLGKIQIPAEILSKPGKITDLELGLIKVHPQAGYDILKGINFPWPIAQMVLQHHERMDGSGYPQGLKGDAILLEARILAVADVVEAISAHRPYRPGFGIEVALEEITKQRGIHYDSRVVDACLAVFREQGYRFR